MPDLGLDSDTGNAALTVGAQVMARLIEALQALASKLWDTASTPTGPG